MSSRKRKIDVGPDGLSSKHPRPNPYLSSAGSAAYTASSNRLPASATPEQTAAQVETLLSPGVKTNPLTSRPLTKQYYDILAKRRELPVFSFLSVVADTLNKHQVLVLEGETGSGKTTQIPVFGAGGLRARRRHRHGPDGGLHAASSRCCNVGRRARADELDVQLGRRSGTHPL